MVEMSVDVNEDDMKLFQSPSTTPNELQEHLAFMTANAKGKTEVNIRNLTTEEQQQFEEAKGKAVDQWISNSVFKIVRRAGVTYNGDETGFDLESSTRWHQCQSSLSGQRVHRPGLIDDPR